MKRFVQLFQALDETSRTNDKVAALQRYFASAPPGDAAWTLYFLTGRKLARSVTSTQLRIWAGGEVGLPAWLVEECYDAVGDLAETVALLLPAGSEQTEMSLHALVETRLLPLTQLPESARRDLLVQTWRELSPRQRFLCNRLITGAFRVGVAHTLVARALAQVANIPPANMAHRLMGDWQPTEADYQRLLAVSAPEMDVTQPYPFHLACPLDDDPADLGSADAWQAEWKWDGIRAQLIRRQGQILLWSRGEELMTGTFPEIKTVGHWLPDGTVLDGEIVAWRGDRPLPFGQLQRRLSRKNPGQAIRREVPVCFMAYDLLETDGADCRAHPLAKRRELLESTVASTQHQFEAESQSRPAPLPPAPTQGELFNPAVWPSAPALETIHDQPALALRLSPILPLENWRNLKDHQHHARQQGVEGIMLKHRQAPYGVGRQRGAWWKWKVEPFHVDAVLIAAQPGHGRRASLFTDYTFGVWNGAQLVPVAKAYSGLNDDETRQVDAFVRQNTIERYGPVRFVKPELVFELAFEGIQPSTRHKAGLALRFPRLARWRQDKTAREADTLETVRGLLFETG
jgi:DNA ligase-1